MPLVGGRGIDLVVEMGGQGKGGYRGDGGGGVIAV